MKKEMEYQGCGEEYNVKKVRGETIYLFYYTYKGCWVEYQVGKRGRVTENFGKKIKILKNGDVEEYQFVGNFIHPCLGTDPVLESSLCIPSHPVPQELEEADQVRA